MASRPQKTTDILDWEELEQAPNVRGAYSFLNASAQVVSIRRDGEPRTIAGEQQISSTVDRTSLVDDVSTVDSLRPISARHRRKVHECKLVQDGHSQGETILYEVLWSLGPGEAKEYREVTIGWDRMSHRARMSDKAAKRNLTSLMAKLAVELVREEDSARRIGRTYRVFSYSEILERRKAAGLLYVVRDKGVRFVTADGQPLPIEQNSCLGRKTSTVDVSTTVDETSPVSMDETSPVSMDETSPVSMDETSPLLGSYLDNSLGNTSSTSEDEEQVLAALTMYAVADRHAAEQLIRSCRATCPDVQSHEITALIREKAAIMRTRGKVANPVGFLLTAVPRCCEPQTLRELRRRQQDTADLVRRKTAIAQERELEQIRYFRRCYQMYLTVLKDPASSAVQIQRTHERIAELKRWFEDAGITPDE